MGRKPRVRYVSKRERLMTHLRNARLIIIFGLIALIILIYKNRLAITDWFVLNF